jgi:hypothetical protein
MIELHKILYVTIADWQNAERVRREDWAFDAYDHLARAIGHKNSSTLRKMCCANHGGAKLGLEEAITIMNETQDYRLAYFFNERLKEGKSNKDQLNLFSQPLRTL